METVTLMNCCHMQTGLLIARHDFSENGALKVIQLKDIDTDGKLKPHLESVDLEREVYHDKLIRNNDILLKGRGTKLTATLIEQAPENTIATAAYFILRPESHILPGYLAWYLSNHRLPFTQSTTMHLLRLSDLREMRVPLLPDKVQLQIIDTNQLIEEAQALSNQYYAKTRQLLKGIVPSTKPSKEDALRHN